MMLERDFKMTHLRMLEKVSRGWNSPKAESEIPFWEFLDIEFDEEEFTFILTPHYNLDESMAARFPEIGGGGQSAESNIEIESGASPDEYDSSPPPDPSNFQDSKEIAIEKMGLSKGSSIMRFQWFVMPDGRKIHIKYSKWYDGDNHQYFWYGVTPKSLMIAHERGVECFGFIAGKEGCVVVDLETLLEYVTEAQVSTNKEDISVIRHYHLFINREMRLIHNRTDERSFESEFVPFG